MAGQGRDSIAPIAENVPFDNLGKKFNSDNSQDAIEEVRSNAVLTIDDLTSSLNGNHNILPNNSNIHLVKGTATGYSVTLPDATELFLGRRFEVVNESSESVEVKDSSGSVLTTLIVGDTGVFTLDSNPSAAGTWLQTIVTSAATGITSYVVTSDTSFATTSNTDILITGFSVTPAPGRYSVFSSADFTIGANNAITEYVVYVDATAVENTRRAAQGVSSNFVGNFNTIGEINVDGTDSVDVRINITSGTFTIGSRSLVLIRLGGAVGI